MTLVICCYYLDPMAVIKLIRFVALILNLKIRNCILVGNKNIGLSYDSKPFRIISGSNTMLDFSAWREGIADIERAESIPPYVVFLNDTFFLTHPYLHMLRWFRRFSSLSKKIALPAMGGELHHYRSGILRNPIYKNERYISTFGYILNTDAIKLFKKIYDEEMFNFTDEKFDEFLRLHTGEKLFSISIAGRENNAGYLQKKMRSIKFEATLSGLILSSGLLFPTNAVPREKVCTFFSRILAAMTKPLIFWICRAK